MISLIYFNNINKTNQNIWQNLKWSGTLALAPSSPDHGSLPNLVPGNVSFSIPINSAIPNKDLNLNVSAVAIRDCIDCATPNRPPGPCCSPGYKTGDILSNNNYTLIYNPSVTQSQKWKTDCITHTQSPYETGAIGFLDCTSGLHFGFYASNNRCLGGSSPGELINYEYPSCTTVPGAQCFILTLIDFSNDPFMMVLQYNNGSAIVTYTITE